MKILQAQTLQGPNYWSKIHSKLILVRLDLESLTNRSTDTISGFYEGLVAVLPSLEEHFCLSGYRGGFLRRVQKGTTVAHILEHVALELQTLADMPVGFGRTRETTTPGIYQVAIEYQVEAAGRYAIRAARRLCQSIVETGHYPQAELQKDLADLADLKSEAALGASTEALVKEAESRGIPWTELEHCNLFQLGYGKYQRRVQAALTSHSNVLGVELACDKERTKTILSSMGAPVPLGTVIYDFRELEDAIQRLGGYPIVMKPLNGNHGRGITINIQSWRQAKVAYDRARDVSRGVIVEHFYQGRDHRILVVNHKVIAVAERVPAHVMGNGVDTIATLVNQENQDARRGKGHDNLLTHIELDHATDEVLSHQGYTLDTILPPGQICYLRATANLSTGGIAIDRTDAIHPDTVWLAERVSRILDLDVAGIDVITTDITQPLAEADGVIVEVNAAPGLRMHIAPSEGAGRNVAAPILDMLFPPGTPTRIPIVAVTGTNGKATPTPLMAHIFCQVYGVVGYTTAEGIYIGDRLLKKGDSTEPQTAQVLLQDPTVEMAVLETTRDGILSFGLPFQHCDVGVVLNVAADHLGQGDIHTLEQMAQVSGVVAGTVHAKGYAILNADDERVAGMAEQVRGKVAYFSMNPENPLVRSHVQRGGTAAVYEQGHLSILQQDWVYQIESVDRVPLVVGGCAPFMIANALAASLTAFVQGVTVEQIRAALHSFQSPAQQTLGQIDLLNLKHYPFDVFQPYSDLRDGQETILAEQRPQVFSLQQKRQLVSSACNGATLSLSNGLRQRERTAVTAQGNIAGKRGQEVGAPSAVQWSAEQHHSQTPTTSSAELPNPEPATPAATEAKGGEIPTRKTAPTSVQRSFAHRLQAHIEAAQPKAIAVQKTLKNFVQTLRQRGAKAWATEQTAQVSTWLAAKAPRGKQAALRTLQKLADQVFEASVMAGTIAFILGRAGVEKGIEQGKVWGAIAWEKFEKATALVDPLTLDPTLMEAIALWGKEGHFGGEVFDLQLTKTGVDVHLKDGTPVYTEGKLNPQVDGRFSFLLSQMPELMAKVKTDRNQQPTNLNASNPF